MTSWGGLGKHVACFFKRGGEGFRFCLLVVPPDLAIARARGTDCDLQDSNAHSEAASCLNAWRLGGAVAGTAVGIR